MNSPFYGRGGRRATLEEVHERIRGLLNSEPVYGLSEIVDLGDAQPGGDRISGFLERHRFGEWLLRVSAARGLSWRTEAVPATSLPAVSFFFGAGFGNGSPLPQPSGCWDVYVNDRFAVSMRVVNHSQVWDQGQCSLAFAANRLESAPPYAGLTLSSLIRDEAFATFGPAILTVPTAWLAPGFPAVIRVAPRGEYPSTRWFQLDESPGIFMQGDIYRALDLLGEGRYPRANEHNVYFGDIHTHSGQVLAECENHGCGRGTRESNYRYARGPGGLDFYALTDHEWQVAPTPDAIAEYLGLADEHNEEGRFACQPACEHTNLLYGHRTRTGAGAARRWTRQSASRQASCGPVWRNAARPLSPCRTIPRRHPIPARGISSIPGSTA